VNDSALTNYSHLSPPPYFRTSFLHVGAFAARRAAVAGRCGRTDHHRVPEKRAGHDGRRLPAGRASRCAGNGNLFFQAAPDAQRARVPSHGPPGARVRQMFHARIPEMTLEAIREATNKAWVLGSERFKRRIAKQLVRPMTSGGHGGDRRSEAYQRAVNNQRV
jgi:hypothetical protein